MVLGLLAGAEIKKEQQVTYSPQITYPYAQYSPTYAQQYQIDYTAPVIQIQSPEAKVTSTKKQEQMQRTEPNIAFIPTLQPEQKQTQASQSDVIPLLIIGVIGLGAVYLFTKVK